MISDKKKYVRELCAARRNSCWSGNRFARRHDPDNSPLLSSSSRASRQRIFSSIRGRFPWGPAGPHGPHSGPVGYGRGRGGLGAVG